MHKKRRGVISRGVDFFLVLKGGEEASYKRDGSLLRGEKRERLLNQNPTRRPQERPFRWGGRVHNLPEVESTDLARTECRDQGKRMFYLLSEERERYKSGGKKE